MQRQVPFARPVLGDREKRAVAEVLDGHILVHGPRISEFEAAFAAWTGAARAVAVSSCTAGLHLAYFCRGIGPGDEVIVPAMTHVATAHAVELVGARPVFVDCEPRTGNIDLDQVEAAITPRTRALSLVHYLGLPVDMDRVAAIARRHELFVVEDCALAIGARFRDVHAGLLGDIGLFSFYPVKHMTTAEGGMVLSRHPELLEQVALQRAFGVDRTHRERVIPGDYDVPQLGFNYRMNEISAALGIEQIARLDGFLAARERNYHELAQALAGTPEIELLESSRAEFRSSYYCQSIVLGGPFAARRVEFIQSLSAKGIGTSIYYPKPVPHLTYYREKYGFSAESFPNASRIAYRSVALPVGPHLEPGDPKFIAEQVRNVITEMGS
jgi:dTDP-4-amino-4,6-dideoxygalactose transaminase